MAQAENDKTQRRGVREDVLRSLSELAESLELTPLGYRPQNASIQTLFKEVCAKVDADQLLSLKLLRDRWLQNGGCELLESLIGGAEKRTAAAAGSWEQEPEAGRVPGHHVLTQTFYPRKAAEGFRLCARAFMLTYNALAFVLSPKLWGDFQDFVTDRVKVYGATYYSCTIETSDNAVDIGRIHLHAYFSWHDRKTPTIDHRTTDAWVFQDVRPRVDVNKERRGPHEWLRAAEHGHFYVQVWKKGTVHASTNYPPWTGLWAPEAWWVVSLWKKHKLDHEAMLYLSSQLRDGHARRKAEVEAVISTETFHKHALEQRAALEAIAAKALPMKPLHPDIEAWMMHFEEVDDRYKFLLLFGPSRTGKSRLARALFGNERTLVVDILNAEHPNLKAFSRSKHRAILLDEMKSADFIVKNKKAMQSHVDGAELGQSPTQQFVYSAFLWRTPLIITTNNFDLSTMAPVDREWVLANAVAVHIAEPVWVTKGTAKSNLKRSAASRTPLTTPQRKFAYQACSLCGQSSPCGCPQ